MQDFIECVSGPSSLYGLQPATLDSLVLSLLPSLMHGYESPREPSASHEHLKDSSVMDESLKKPSAINSNPELKVLLMQEMLQNLRHCAGFHIPPVSILRKSCHSSVLTTCLSPLQCCVDELPLDTECIFELVLSDPKFDGLLSNLSNSEALQVVTEAMRELYNAPAPQVFEEELCLIL